MSGSQLSEPEKDVMKKSVPMSEALETANLLKSPVYQRYRVQENKLDDIELYARSE